MPRFTLPLDEKGPLLNVVVEVSGARSALLRSLGQTAPSRVPVRALVDTGASVTCVDPYVMNRLGITPRGKTPCLTPSTGTAHVLMDEYDVCRSVYRNMNEAPCRIENLAVVESVLNPQGFHVLLGRDFLSRCILHCNGMTRNYTLAF